MASVTIKEKPGGAAPWGFCCAPHPTNGEVWCRRFPHTEGKHRAFSFSIKTPEEWDG